MTPVSDTWTLDYAFALATAKIKSSPARRPCGKLSHSWCLLSVTDPLCIDDDMEIKEFNHEEWRIEMIIHVLRDIHRVIQLLNFPGDAKCAQCVLTELNFQNIEYEQMTQSLLPSIHRLQHMILEQTLHRCVSVQKEFKIEKHIGSRRLQFHSISYVQILIDMVQITRASRVNTSLTCRNVTPQHPWQGHRIVVLRTVL